MYAQASPYEQTHRPKACQRAHNAYPTTSCSSRSSSKYFHDQSSSKRQKKLKEDRLANVISGIGIGILSTFSSAAFEVDLGWYPSEQEFKKIKLISFLQFKS